MRPGLPEPIEKGLPPPAGPWVRKTVYLAFAGILIYVVALTMQI